MVQKSKRTNYTTKCMGCLWVICPREEVHAKCIVALLNTVGVYAQHGCGIFGPLSGHHTTTNLPELKWLVLYFLESLEGIEGRVVETFPIGGKQHHTRSDLRNLSLVAGGKYAITGKFPLLGIVEGISAEGRLF